MGGQQSEKKDPEGVAFPKDSKGTRSTTSAGKKIFADAIAGYDDTLATSIGAEKDWRHKYPKYLMPHGAAMMASPESAFGIAAQGLKSVYDSFEFIRGEKTLKLADAMAELKQPCFSAGVVTGEGSGVSVLQLRLKGKTLAGAEVEEQLRAWADRGVVEPDVAAAVKEVGEHPEWQELSAERSGKVFVLLGATSELCPLEALLARGATVVAIARPGRNLAKLLDTVKAGPGSLVVPLPAGTEGWTKAASETTAADLAAAGADILTQAPEVAAFLEGLYPGKQLVVGSYIYLDGEAHVRASVAMDAVAQAVCAARPDTALAYLGTPTVTYPIPAAACEDAASRARRAPWWHAVVGAVVGGLKRAAAPPLPGQGGPFHMYPGFSVVQGPNYALAKTVQTWRAMAARAAGHTVSFNITPMSMTDSVMHVGSVAKAVKGCVAFEPLLPFQPGACKDLMAALLLYDVASPSSPARASSALANPMLLLASGGAHSGLWRCPYTFESISVPSAMFGMFK